MRLLVAGLGSIGSRHAANAAALPGIETAVFDVSPETAGNVGNRLGVPFFNSWREALAWKPEAAVVAVPTSAHVQVASDLVHTGAHVLMEKPISDRLDKVDPFLDEAESLGRRVFVVCNMRFHPAIQAVRSALPGIGRMRFARAHYGNYLPDMRPGADYRQLYCARRETGGGVILDAIHEIDYLTWLFGPVKSVSCESAKLSDLEIDVEDVAEIVLRHAGGVFTQTHLDYLRRFKRRGLEVVGAEGSVVWLSEGKNPEQCTVRRYTPAEGWETLYAQEALDAAPMYFDMMERFVLTIQNRESQDLLTGRAARSELACVLAAHRSGSEGRVVHVDEIERQDG